MQKLGGSSGRRIPAYAAHWHKALLARRLHHGPSSSQNFEEFLDSNIPPYPPNGPPNSTAIQNDVGFGGLAVRPASRGGKVTDVMAELERRVSLLEEAVETQDPAAGAPLYSETELLGFYEDVLAHEAPNLADQQSIQAMQEEEERQDKLILSSLEERLCQGNAISSDEPVSTCRQILIRAHEIASQLEATRKLVDPESSAGDLLPIPVLTVRESEALVRLTVRDKDAKAAELALQIMKRTSLPLPEGAVTELLELHTQSGSISDANRILSTFLTTVPTEEQRHLHVQAHLNSVSLDTLPLSAMELVHHYENQAIPVPVKTYTSIINSLFTRQSSLARSQAWDLFMHMRYAAHPNPDQLLYTLMIRACASPISTRHSSEPERALDLWTEMTVDQKLTPSVGSYNAVILACARSGTKAYVNEAFRLARQMLDSHRDAYGYSAFRPDRKTFCALLEGAKRIGDLGRARWILAEMVKGPEPARPDDRPVDAEINEEVMMHLFHAYAAYNPPFVRAATKIVEDGRRSTTTSVEPTSAPSTEGLVASEDDAAPSFAHISPQSRSEVIRETEFLFDRILEASQKAPAKESPVAADAFRSVRLTTPLLNSYLSVFYRHADLEESRQLFWRIFEDLRVPRSVRSYVEAMERCAITRRGRGRKGALQFARELWEKWEVLEEQGRFEGRPLSARLVERMHCAMIRVLALTENLDDAMERLRAFATRYPPQDIRTPPAKLAIQSTRVSLVGNRPLIRMTSAAEVPDDHVPPLMTFRDLEILHHRLIDEDRKKDIGYVTWLCKTYEWALRVRRDTAVKARPASSDAKEVAPIVD